MKNEAMYTFFSSKKNSVPSYDYIPNNNTKQAIAVIEARQHQPKQLEVNDYSSTDNNWSCDDKVKGSAAGCGALGLLTCGVAGGIIATAMGYICAKDNPGPIGEVFREVGDVMCTFGGTLKDSKLLGKSLEAAKSVMGMGSQTGTNVNNTNKATISSSEKFLNADGEYIRDFEKRLD